MNKRPFCTCIFCDTEFKRSGEVRKHLTECKKAPAVKLDKDFIEKVKSPIYSAWCQIASDIEATFEKESDTLRNKIAIETSIDADRIEMFSHPYAPSKSRIPTSARTNLYSEDEIAVQYLNLAFHLYPYNKVYSHLCKNIQLY